MVNLVVLVIGVGTVPAVTRQSLPGRVTRSVGVIERGLVGGDCVFNACIPTKALVHAARLHKKMQSADFFGLPAVSGGVDYRKAKHSRPESLTVNLLNKWCSPRVL